MKIHLLGASGAGATTLGEHLAGLLACPYFDSDAYYWEPSEPPFTLRRNPDDRNQRLVHDLSGHTSWILGGSLVNWGEYWLTVFDLVVFLWIPAEIRMERIRKREFERYGNVIFNDPDRHQQYTEFIEWAMGYDTNTASGRTLAIHQDWLKKLSCPVLEIKGDFSVEQRAQMTVEKIACLQAGKSSL